MGTCSSCFYKRPGVHMTVFSHFTARCTYVRCTTDRFYVCPLHSCPLYNFRSYNFRLYKCPLYNWPMCNCPLYNWLHDNCPLYMCPCTSVRLPDESNTWSTQWQYNIIHALKLVNVLIWNLLVTYILYWRALFIVVYHCDVITHAYGDVGKPEWFETGDID